MGKKQSKLQEPVGSFNPEEEKKKKTSDSLALLISYLSLIGIWFAIPSITLLINKDRRWPLYISLLGGVVLFLVLSYIFKWRFLFPPSSTEIVNESNL